VVTPARAREGKKAQGKKAKVEGSSPSTFAFCLFTFTLN
jgi:hypothetical protein